MHSWILITALWVPAILLAAEDTRPRVGLVPEGGGALGLAHIGVPKWLEAHRIRVDCVAGASMGDLVGGLYAAGKSPAETRELVETINWNTVLAGQTPFELNYGFEVESILDRALLPYSSIYHFDNKLPIPFRCIATDMISG